MHSLVRVPSSQPQRLSSSWQYYFTKTAFYVMLRYIVSLHLTPNPQSDWKRRLLIPRLKESGLGMRIKDSHTPRCLVLTTCSLLCSIEAAIFRARYHYPDKASLQRRLSPSRWPPFFADNLDINLTQDLTYRNFLWGFKQLTLSHQRDALSRWWDKVSSFSTVEEVSGLTTTESEWHCGSSRYSLPNCANSFLCKFPLYERGSANKCFMERKRINESGNAWCQVDYTLV